MIDRSTHLYHTSFTPLLPDYIKIQVHLKHIGLIILNAKPTFFAKIKKSRRTTVPYA